MTTATADISSAFLTVLEVTLLLKTKSMEVVTGHGSVLSVVLFCTNQYVKIKNTQNICHFYVTIEQFAVVLQPRLSEAY